ncbi:zinc finger CCCH domain-containing protein 45 [Cladorrhinum sp. PSN259]|nr:zinc finger CCCH domain-containing protein 45 [Cladorrhinum sp. PSN259]
MGDTPHQPGAPTEYQPRESPGMALSHSSIVGPSNTAAGYPSVYPSPHPQQQPADSQTQLDMSQQQRTPGPFDMNGLGNALPQHQQHHQQQPQQHHHHQPGYRAPTYSHSPQRYNTAAMPSPGTGAQTPVSHMGPAPNHQYYLAQQVHMAHYYPPPVSPPQPGSNPPSRADVNYYPGAPMIVNQQHHPGAHYYYQTAAFPGQGPHVQAQLSMLGQYAHPHPQHQLQEQQSQQQQPQQQPLAHQHQHHQQQQPSDYGAAHPVPSTNFSTESRQANVVRGPPRKPRQSGHAIWIGNLPPQTELMDLVHHVCKETDGLESLFLISKSSCAFANFKDEEASIAAQRKLHDSKFMMVKLVSRLRKSTVEGPAGTTAPTGPASSSQLKGPAPNQVATGNTNDTNGDKATAPGVETPPTVAESTPVKLPTVGAGATQKDRFFILKSLTIEDLDLSVQTGIWATQSHNEQTLNDAFNNSENVYLVFSANKSGEYFGYARMTSPINDDPTAAIEFAPKAHSTASVDLPKAIPTEATEFAPKGRIIDDSARGTIFWEAENDDQTQDEVQDEEGQNSSQGEGDTGSVKSGQDGEVKAWGKPFQLEWLSTNRLPFYRTRGLRNPWNSNREVKIARDGTELEPSVGRKLIGLFNRVQSPPIGVVPGMLPPHVIATGGPRIPIPVTVAGFVPIRPA